jgi:hypothetical protein
LQTLSKTLNLAPSSTLSPYPLPIALNIVSKIKLPSFAKEHQKDLEQGEEQQVEKNNAVQDKDEEGNFGIDRGGGDSKMSQAENDLDMNLKTDEKKADDHPEEGKNDVLIEENEIKSEKEKMDNAKQKKKEEDEKLRKLKEKEDKILAAAEKKKKEKEDKIQAEEEKRRMKQKKKEEEEEKKRKKKEREQKEREEEEEKKRKKKEKEENEKKEKR